MGSSYPLQVSQWPSECPRIEEEYTDEDYYTEIDIVVAAGSELENDDYHSYYYCCDFLNLDNFTRCSYDGNATNLSMSTSKKPKPPVEKQNYYQGKAIEGYKVNKDKATLSHCNRRKTKLNLSNYPNKPNEQMKNSNNSSVYVEAIQCPRSNYLKNALFSTSSHLRCNILKPLQSPLHRHKASSSPLKTVLRNFINCRLRYQLL